MRTARFPGKFICTGRRGPASDRRIALQPDAQGRQTLDTRELSAGLWRLRVHWRVDGEDFAFDEKLVIGARQPG